MRLPLLLLLGALAAASVPPVRAARLLGVGASVSSHAPRPDRLVAAGTLVEPADAEGSLGGLTVGSGTKTESVRGAPGSSGVLIPPTLGTPVPAERPHLLDRASHPSTAPPLRHA